MDKKTRDRLTTAGFRVGDAEDLLGLSEEERQLVEFAWKSARPSAAAGKSAR